MAKITVCDICGKQPAKTYHFSVDRKLDAAGSMDDVVEEFDLCSTHYALALSETLFHFSKAAGFSDYDARELLVHNIRKRVK